MSKNDEVRADFKNKVRYINNLSPWNIDHRLPELEKWFDDILSQAFAEGERRAYRLLVDLMEAMTKLKPVDDEYADSEYWNDFRKGYKKGKRACLEVILKEVDRLAKLTEPKEEV